MDRQAWLQERRKYLGASEVAAVCGLCPFGSPLTVWASKKGLGDEIDSDATEFGRRFEAPLLAYYAEKTKATLTTPGVLYHPRHRWMAANLDAVANGKIDVQAKIVGTDMAHHWDSGAPDYVQCQVQWEMNVSGLQVAHVVACIGGTEYRCVELPRDDVMIGHLVEICTDFWQRHIVGGEMPEIDASEEAKRILARRFKTPTQGMGEAVPEIIADAREYLRLSAEIGDREKAKKLIANSLRLAIGDRAGLKWLGGYVSWKADKNGERRLYVHEKE